MKFPLRLLGLSILFLAQVPAVSARFIDDFVLPAGSSSSSSAGNASDAADGQSSSVSSSPSSSVPMSRLRVVPQPQPTAEERRALEEALPETRAGFVSMIVRRLYNNVTIDTCFWDIASELPPRFTLVFTDVPTDHPHAKEICVAMKNGIIRGYGDGSFRPDGQVTFAEASKMISRAYSLHPWADVAAAESNPWFDVYVRTLDERGAIPSSIRSFDQRMARGDVTEILDRLDGRITSRVVTPLSSLREDWRRRFAPPVRRATPAIRRTAPQPVAAPAASSTGQSSSAVNSSSTSSAAQSSSVRSYPAWIY